MLTVGLILGLTVAAGRWLRPPDGAVAGINWVIINLALPSVVLRTVPDLELGGAALVPVAVAWSMVALGALAVLALSARAGWSRSVTGALLLVVPLGNTSFLGFPAVEALLGAEALPSAILYDQLGTFLALTTYGAVVAARYGTTGNAGTEGGSALRRVVLRVAVFPPFVALVAGFAARGVEIPPVVDDALRLLAMTLTPLAMVSIGLRLAGRRLRWPSGPVAAGLVLRLVVMPGVVLGAAAVLGGSGVAWDAAVLESAMPSMVTAGIVATSAGLDEDTVTSLVGLGLVASLLTLPIWSLALGA